MAKIILSAFADEYSNDFTKQIDILKKNDFEMIELRFVGTENITSISVEKAKEIKKQLDDNGLKVASIGSKLGKISLSDDFEKHLEVAKNAFEVANILETKNVRVFSFFLHENKTANECFGEVVDKLAKMLELAASYKLTLCHENEGKMFGESPENCLKLFKTFNGKLRGVFDMGNFVLDGYKPFPDAYNLLKNYIEYFHIKDCTYQGAIVPPGKGDACINAILNAYKNDFNRDFIVTLEPHLYSFRGLSSLVFQDYSNPYKFDNREDAFCEAIKCFKEIV